MTHDDAHTSHNHGFELPDAPQVVVRGDTRRWRALAGVALCLGLAGIVTGLIVARRQSVSDEHLTSDALQREELRDGWRALGAAAAQDAQANSVQPNTAATAAAAPPNVVIVNVPTPSGTAAPTNVTNINVPTGSALLPNGAATDSANANPGYTPSQSLPAINFSPVPGYVPPGSTATSPSNTPQPNYLPQYNYGTSPGSVPPLTPAVGNGSIPGSTPNPALPNNGLVGSSPVPGVPNGSMNGSAAPSAPIGTIPTSPGTTTLPSGFSAP